jgi:hypothetical protein
MTRARLQLLLSSALFAALAPACGGSVITEAGDEDAGGDDAASDTMIAKTDTGTTRVDTGVVMTDTKPPIDTAPIEMGSCTPVADNSPCNEKVTYPCGLPFAPSSPPTSDECKSLCAPVMWSYGPPGFLYCSVSMSSGGGSLVYCTSCAVGRKPADLLENNDGPCDGEDPVGTALAEMARIEAASVHAFRRLERSLTGLGADVQLRDRARRAARDEIAHARLATRLAKKRGAHLRPVRLAHDATPTTFELALENAVEGCVHETLGVAYLEHQRTHATDPELRAHADALYDDELEHAALSWDLVAFFDQHLDSAQRSELRRATERALDEVVDEIGRVDGHVRQTLGLPPREVVARMVNTLRETLFAA